MPNLIRSRPRRAVAVLLALPLLGAALLVAALSRSADAASTAVTLDPIQGVGLQVSGTFGTNQPLNDRFAGTLRVQINGEPASAYCIDLTRPIGPGISLGEEEWETAGLSATALDAIARILANNFPNPENPSFPLTGSQAERAAAVQAAIWHFSDNFTPNFAAGTPVQTSYTTIVAALDGVAPDYPAFGGNPTSPSLSITPNNALGNIGAAIGPFTVNSNVSGSTVALSLADGTLVNADGTPWAGDPNSVVNGSQFWIRRDNPGTSQATVTTDATIGTGRVFIARDAAGNITAQKIILATPVTVAVNASATATAVPPSELQVTKSVEGATANETFSFVVTGPGLPQGGAPFSITTSGGGVTSDKIGGLVAGGSYTITETAKPGFAGQATGCTAAENVQTNGASVSFTVPAAGGALITCSFTNSRVGRITIVKATQPPGVDQDFQITVSGPGAPLSGIINAGQSKNLVFDQLPPGTYTIAEPTVPGGWVAGQLVCSADGGSAVEVAPTTLAPATTVATPPGAVQGAVVGAPPTGSNVVPLQPGASWTCTVTNVRQLSQITVEKVPSNATPLVGETVTYSFRVTNTGDVPLTNVTLIDSDGDIELGPITLDKTTLAPGESATGTATYTPVEADAGLARVNRARASGTTPTNETITADTQAIITPVQVLPTTVAPTASSVARATTSVGQRAIPVTGSPNQVMSAFALLILGSGFVLYGYGRVRPRHARSSR